MTRIPADFWNERVSGNNDSESLSRSSNNGSSCGCKSLKALRNILFQLDDLNNSDLCLLDDIIERLLRERKYQKQYSELTSLLVGKSVLIQQDGY